MEMGFPWRDRCRNSVDLRISLFTIYVYDFASYNKTYGSLSTPLVLLTWMWVSVFVVLFGAEINGEAERQTRQDTSAEAPVLIGRGGTKGADVVPSVRHRRR